MGGGERAVSGRSWWRHGAVALALATAAGCASSLEKAQDAQRAGDAAAAADLYRAAMSDADDADAAKRALFELSMNEGKATLQASPPTAEQHFRTALELEPSEPKARLGLARALLRQQRSEEAEQVLAREGGCDSCEALRLLLVLDEGDLHLEAERIEEAMAAFRKALELSGGRSARAALGVADAWSRGANLNAAMESLQAAAGLIADDEAAEAKRFAVIRARIAVRAAEAGNVALADRALAIDARAVGQDAFFAGQLAVARAELKNGELDDPIARLSRLVPDAIASPTSGTVVSSPYADMAPSRRAEVVALLVDLYSSRAALYLRRDELGPAENDLTFALRLDPDNATVKLQRVLAISGFGKLDLAFHKLEQIPRETAGHDEVEAILLAMRVEAHLDAGRMEKAHETMVKAQGRGDLPEVHVAFARLLANSPMTEVDDGARQKLQASGIVDYPDGKIHRYAEALAELAWAKNQIDSYGVRFPYRGPGTEESLRQLETSIRSFYPLEVSFHDSDKGVLVFRHAQPGPLTIRVLGPGGLDERLEVPSGPEGMAREMPASGLIEIEGGGRRVAVVSEPFTQIVVPL